MHTRADSRTYVGRLEASAQAVYIVDAVGVERLNPPALGFGWGVDAIGDSTELARTLLADAGGTEPTAEACRLFIRQILSRLPQDGFTLQRDTVSSWLRRFVTAA